MRERTERYFAGALRSLVTDAQRLYAAIDSETVAYCRALDLDEAYGVILFMFEYAPGERCLDDVQFRFCQDLIAAMMNAVAEVHGTECRTYRILRFTFEAHKNPHDTTWAVEYRPYVY